MINKINIFRSTLFVLFVTLSTTTIPKTDIFRCTFADGSTSIISIDSSASSFEACKNEALKKGLQPEKINIDVSVPRLDAPPTWKPYGGIR